MLVDDENLSEAIRATIPLIRNKQPVFEATLEYDGLLVRADLLVPVGGGYRLIEVKSSSGMKDYYKDEFTVQKWVFDKNDVKVKTVELACIDSNFLYLGDGDYSGLLKFINADEIVSENIANVPQWVKGARETLAGDEPDIKCGKQCYNPFECPFIEYCNTEAEAPQYGLNIYYRMQKRVVEELETKGIINGLEVPDEYLNATNKRIKEVTKSGKYYLEQEAKEKLDALAFPRYYFDFETIAFTIPKWAQSRPFEQIPFQWSCHIEDEDGNLTHHEFLDVTGDDPRRKCAEKMLATLGKQGPIIVYNQSFEKRVIRELAAGFPDLADDLLELNERVFDLLPIMQNHYYHPNMYGSWSIKAVLPTIAPELSYDNLEVGNGGDAQEAYIDIINPNTEAETREMLTTALLKYCEQDTFAMVKIVEFIRGKLK